MSNFGEWMQVLLDHLASGQLGARDILMGVSGAGLSSGLSAATVQQAITAGETQTLNQAKANEKSAVIDGAGDTPNRHDMLTGSQTDGARLYGRLRSHLWQLDQQRRRLG